MKSGTVKSLTTVDGCSVKKSLQARNKGKAGVGRCAGEHFINLGLKASVPSQVQPRSSISQ